MKLMTWRGRLPDPRDIPNPVHDGDSIWLCTDQGDWDRKVRACRLSIVYAPETQPLQRGGLECKAFVQAWIDRWNTGKWPYQVDTLQDGNSRDMMTFGRFVTIVWNQDRTAQLNAEIQAFVVANGYAGGSGT